MFKLIKYAVRQDLNLRLLAVGAAVAVNAVFGVLSLGNLSGPGMKITAVTLSSLALCGILVALVMADAKALQSVYAAPDAYLTMLTPTPVWKLLLSKILSIVALDWICLLIGIGGVVLQSFLLTGLPGAFLLRETRGTWLWGVVILLLNYALLITAFFFGSALTNSILFRLRARGLLGFLGLCAALYGLSLLDFSLAAVAPLTRFGPFYSVVIGIGFHTGMLCYLFLTLVKWAILFVCAVYLTERRINL